MSAWKWSGAIAGAALLAFTGPYAVSQDEESPAVRAPQLIPRTHEQREARYIAQHRMILNAEVTDASGAPVTDLKQSDFALYDNGQPRELVAFSLLQADTAIAPPHVILVLDAVNNNTSALRAQVQSVQQFLQSGEAPFPYALSLGILAGSYIDLGPSTRDREILLTDLQDRTKDIRASGCITQGDGSDTPAEVGLVGNNPTMARNRSESTQKLMCLNERFIASGKAIFQLAQQQVNVSGRVILIWIGPGWPLLTNQSYAPNPPDIKQQFFAFLVTLSMALREAQITVNAVASPDDLPYPGAPHASSFFSAVTEADEVKAGNLGLHALANQTGGRIRTDTADFAQQINACIADGKSFYAVSFDSTPAAEFGEYHELSLKVNRPGLVVRTNAFYYAEQ